MVLCIKIAVIDYEQIRVAVVRGADRAAILSAHNLRKCFGQPFPKRCYLELYYLIGTGYFHLQIGQDIFRPVAT